MIDILATKDICCSVEWENGVVVRSDISFTIPEKTIYASAYAKQIQDFLYAFTEGKCVEIPHLPLDFSSTPPFYIRVYTALQKTSLGERLHYKALAKLAGSSKAVRAVGQAMARNPFPLFVPCHRVVHADGRLGAYTQKEGVAMKMYLLQQEAYALASKIVV